MWISCQHWSHSSVLFCHSSPTQPESKSASATEEKSAPQPSICSRSPMRASPVNVRPASANAAPGSVNTRPGLANLRLAAAAPSASPSSTVKIDSGATIPTKVGLRAPEPQKPKESQGGKGEPASSIVREHYGSKCSIRGPKKKITYFCPDTVYQIQSLILECHKDIDDNTLQYFKYIKNFISDIIWYIELIFCPKWHLHPSVLSPPQTEPVFYSTPPLSRLSLAG